MRAYCRSGHLDYTDALGHGNGIGADCNGVDWNCGSMPGASSDDDGLGFVWIEQQAVKCKPLFNCFEAVVQAGADRWCHRAPCKVEYRRHTASGLS